ncbi:MAG: RNA methyltransferase, partial [Clostridia bacterium]|nr:RNA methyltransferase [Clostridia bacterium]
EKKTTLKEVLEGSSSPKSIAVVIGPEGGISEEEIDAMLAQGFRAVSLGSRILRCETAGLYTLANLNYALS